MSGPLEFGWWIESVDEELYGPVSLTTLERFLEEGVISANTSIRHCCSATAAPIVDQGIVQNVDWDSVKRSGDTLAESWPRRKAERLELAASEVDCVRHWNPAVMTCIRCQAPYCHKCQMPVKRGRTYYMCKKCQSSIFHRRFGAFLGDSFLIQSLPMMLVAPLMAVLAPRDEPGAALAVIYGWNLVLILAFIFRDAAMGGAGPMKRLLGLRVVQTSDGESKPRLGQGFLRWLGHLVPIFNLVDASRAYSDPLMRRFGDGWAKTRVRDTDAKVEKARANARNRLQWKKVDFIINDGDIMSLEEFARLGQ